MLKALAKMAQITRPTNMHGGGRDACLLEGDQQFVRYNTRSDRV
jgi:hypothetical protein